MERRKHQKVVYGFDKYSLLDTSDPTFDPKLWYTFKDETFDEKLK